MKRLKTTKENILDRCIIVGVPIICGLITWIFIKHIIGINKFEISIEDSLKFVESMINVWGILFGFVITSISIFLTMGKNSLFELLIKTNHMYTIILAYILSGINLLIMICFSIFVLFTKIMNDCLISCFIGISVANIVSFLLCFYCLINLLISHINSQ